MSKVIAVSGKGGTGKTTIAALLVRTFKEKAQGPILAVDADPNANLGEILGVKVESTIGDITEEAKKKEDLPAGMTKNEYLRFMLDEIIIENDGFDLLTMGRPEGPGCYCYANNVLRDSLKLLTNNYSLIVIDNEAGFEHISRKTNLKLDYLLVVSDPSRQGLKTAKKVLELAKKIELPVKQAYLVVNRVGKDDEGWLKEEIKNIGLELLTYVNDDKCLHDARQLDKSIFEIADNCSSFKIVNEFANKFLNAKP